MSISQQNEIIVKPNFVLRDFLVGDTFSEFIHKYVHDVGNPLTGIISVCSIMQTMAEMGKLESTKIGEYSAMIAKEAWKLSALNQRLVALISTREPSFAACNIEHNFQNTLQKLQSRDAVKFENLKIDVELLADNLEVIADNNQLNLLATELLTNCAESFARQGELAEEPSWKVRLIISRDTAHDKGICISVISDTSSILKGDDNSDAKEFSSEIKELFEPYITIGFPSEKKLGFGLTIAQVIVERLKGEIELRIGKKDFAVVIKF